jgi:hypothetical protein
MAVAVALTGATATVGCGFGAGSSIGDVELTVTRDYGTQRLLVRSIDDVRESDTVMRVLDRSAEIETRYGGAFVQSISGLSGSASGAHPVDWFFYVNGVESPIGAADFELHDGDRIWWDYRDWSAAMRVPAVVGSWPEPFLHGYEGERHPVALICRAAVRLCQKVRSRLRRVGALVATETAAMGASRADPIRVLVGPWSALRSDDAAGTIEDGPATSGVFADFEPGARGFELVALDEHGERQATMGPGAGLIAATRVGEEPPTWVITGSDASGVGAAVKVLDRHDLERRYALAVEGGRGVPVP